MKNSKLILVFLVASLGWNLSTMASTPLKTKITKAELQDKIKGGWAGQVIGCTFGGPTEFKFRGSMIQDYQPIPWDNQRCKWWYENIPELYDDVYMDLTFVDVFNQEGLNAPASSHAKAFANADYSLWHANQGARYNILNGIMPPQSGYWETNPHSDDIDFQIAADFAGLMSPGMPNTASEICDKVGHIMCYGDGWYGGVYVASMYSLSFVSSDVEYVVTEGLKSIPEQSDFYKCMKDVIAWYYKYPNDWKQTWYECEKKWSSDRGCPQGVFDAFNIDAKINSAYIIIGLLYGHGDFGKTMEISARCGQDSDCNPASAGGILGAMLGYSKIPEYWKAPVYPVEDMKFKYTTMSLNDVYQMSFNQAIDNLKRNGAKIQGEEIELPAQILKPVKLEVGFEGQFPKVRTPMNKYIDFPNTEFSFDFEGTGFVMEGAAQRYTTGDHIFEMEMYIDGKLAESYKMPTDFKTRRHEVAWKYKLQDGKHQVKLKVINPKEGFKIWMESLVVYGSKEVKNAWKTN